MKGIREPSAASPNRAYLALVLRTSTQIQLRWTSDTLGTSYAMPKEVKNGMAYRVFISHSTQDQGLVITLASLLTSFGVEVFVAEWYLTPGEPLDGKVFVQIEEADYMVVLLTRNGDKVKLVHQEVGYALKDNKPLIPVMEKGVEPKDLASLQGKEYIEYDPFQPQQVLIKTATYVKSLKLKKKNKKNFACCWRYPRFTPSTLRRKK